MFARPHIVIVLLALILSANITLVYGANDRKALDLHYSVIGEANSVNKVLHWVVVSAEPLRAIELRCSFGQPNRLNLLLRMNGIAKAGHIAMGQIDLKSALEREVGRHPGSSGGYDQKIQCTAQRRQSDLRVKYDGDLNFIGFDRLPVHGTQLTALRLRVEKRLFDGTPLKNETGSIYCAIYSNNKLIEVAEVPLSSDGTVSVASTEIHLKRPLPSVSGVLCAENLSSFEVRP